MKLCDMLMYRLGVSKFKLQLRKVKSSQQIFTSYGMLEVRLIISDAEITESRVKNVSRCNPLEMRQGAPKQNYIRSLFRDEETRTLLLSKFHTEMRKYAKNIEL